MEVIGNSGGGSGSGRKGLVDGQEVPDLRLWFFIMMVVRVTGFVLILDRQFDLTNAPP